MNKIVFIDHICNYCKLKEKCNKDRYVVRSKINYIRYKCTDYSRKIEESMV